MSWPWTVFACLVACLFVVELARGWPLTPAHRVFRFVYLAWLGSYMFGLPGVVEALLAIAAAVVGVLALALPPLVRGWWFLADALSGDPVPACAVVDCWDPGEWTERDGTPRCMAHVGRPTP